MDRQRNIVMGEKPKLRHPYLVCGIGGWVDGGAAATGSVEYLLRKLGPRQFAEIPIERFHIFQVPGQVFLRPHIKIQDGILKEHRFPQNRFFYWVNPKHDHDLILFLGTEPNLNWEEYADAIVGIADEFAVARTYLLGGVMDKTPHTKEPSVSCACSSEQLKDEMQRYAMHFSSYEGPGRFGTTLLYICQKRALEMVSITVRATYYPEFSIVISPNPKAIRAVVRRLNTLLHTGLDVSDLNKEVEGFEAKINFMASQNAQFRAYVENLEKDFIEVKYEEPLDISANEAVQIAEEFLREKRKD